MVRRALGLLVIVIVLGWTGGGARTSVEARTSGPQPQVLGSVAHSALLESAVAYREKRSSRVGSVTLRELPAEAQKTAALIQRGGPFPYRRDGIIFSNRERRLPPQPRGYYHEYTVVTPGATTRGARRIITGQLPEMYYTDDHYRTFRRITTP
jgi:ribonuclease T1